jgi:hypothetical protein
MFASRVLVLIVTVCASQAAFAQAEVFVDPSSPNPTSPFDSVDMGAFETGSTAVLPGQ